MPKGAIISHGNLTAAASIYNAWCKPAGQAHEGTRSLRCCRCSISTRCRRCCCSSGAEIFLHLRFDVEAMMRDIEVKRATSFPGVPTMWIAIAICPSRQARFVIAGDCGSGGAPLPVEMATILQRTVGMKLNSGWGMTETCSPGTAPSHGRAGQARLDRPAAAGHRARRRRRWTIPTRCWTGELGEFRIKGPNVTKGYWNRPKETAEAFVGDRFLTGDIGYMDGDGYFYLVDRKKDMIISGGFNVYPQMIEQAIYDIPPCKKFRDRHPRRLSRRSGKGLRQVARRRRAVHAGELREFSPARSASMKCRPRSNSSPTCRAPRSANFRVTNCARQPS